jgi:hypothetical protein
LGGKSPTLKSTFPGKKSTSNPIPSSEAKLHFISGYSGFEFWFCTCTERFSENLAKYLTKLIQELKYRPYPSTHVSVNATKIARDARETPLKVYYFCYFYICLHLSIFLTRLLATWPLLASTHVRANMWFVA